VVHTFGRPSNAPVVPVVGIDNHACGRMAARVLVTRGYRHVGFLGGPAAATSTQDRAAGFAAGLKDHAGITLDVSYATGYAFEAGRVEMRRLLAAGPAEAYFCGDDLLALGAISAIEDAGLRVPGDIGLIGLNDMEMARWETNRLTTIRQPLADIITASIDLVVKTIETPDRPPEVHLFPCTFIERGTLRAAP
jgi:DNA-binding LacI/PurR family transcriptional regulator